MTIIIIIIVTGRFASTARLAVWRPLTSMGGGAGCALMVSQEMESTVRAIPDMYIKEFVAFTKDPSAPEARPGRTETCARARLSPRRAQP